nr:hypothetical protein CFP56_08089 [Quercus suber]
MPTPPVVHILACSLGGLDKRPATRRELMKMAKLISMRLPDMAQEGAVVCWGKGLVWYMSCSVQLGPPGPVPGRRLISSIIHLIYSSIRPTLKPTPRAVDNRKSNRPNRLRLVQPTIPPAPPLHPLSLPWLCSAPYSMCNEIASCSLTTRTYFSRAGQLPVLSLQLLSHHLAPQRQSGVVTEPSPPAVSQHTRKQHRQHSRQHSFPRPLY